MIDTSLQRNVLNGFYRGQVIKHCSNGKCKIWIPGVYVEEAIAHPEILPDAEQAAPLFGGSSNGSGVFTYPRINAIVWCFFQNGDQNLPVYFAACNGGPEGAKQYSEIGPDGKYEEYGKEHDHIIDNTDKISDAEIHRINVSKGQISFYEDGSIATTVVKTNPLKAPYNVNLPYSESNHILNDLSNVIFPGMVTDPMFVSDSPYNYHTNDVVSGLNNTAFGISCNINMSPGAVFNEITSKIGACCIKGYKTQCRYVYAKQGSAQKKADVIKPIYLDLEVDVPDPPEGRTSHKEYIPVNYHWEFFNSIYKIDQKADDIPVYQVASRGKYQKAKIDGITYKVGDKIRISKREIVRDITKALVYKVEDKKPQCMVLIAAEDCKIDKWQYILSSGYDLFLCSPTEFDNPVLYFDKPFDKSYGAQCPSKKWPSLVDPKVAAYKASVILMEDRRKFAQNTFNKNGTIGRVLSDSYDESYVQDKLSASGDYEYHAFKQDYEDWNKTHNYYKGECVQAKISGYNAMNIGFANDDDKHNGYISCWNYQVRQEVPKNSAKWWHYNNFFEWDQHNGLCCINNNLSIDDKPEYWQGHIDETTCWPRWKHSCPVNPKLRENISCAYYMNMNEGIAAWNFGHLSTLGNLGDVMSFSRISADYHGDISVEATKEFDLLLTDVRHSDHPKHCGGTDETWTPATPTGSLVPGTQATDSIIPQPHASLPGTEPYIHNEWTHLKFTREGELSVHGTKFIELSCSDPYKQYDSTHVLLSSNGTLSVNNSRGINLMTMAPPIGRAGPEGSIPKGCCDWPVKELKSEMGQPHDVVRTDYKDWPFAKIGLRNDGDADIDVYHQVDIFAAPHQYDKRTWQSLSKSVLNGAGPGSDPCAPPRAHLRLTGACPTNDKPYIVGSPDQDDPIHKPSSSGPGTITGDCCNKIHFFSTNGDIQVQNHNAKGPSEIIINNGPPGADTTGQGGGATTKGISIRNDNNATGGGPNGIELKNMMTSTTGITLENVLDTKGIFLYNDANATAIELDNKSCGDIKIHTANGKIDILADAGGSITMKTASGSIELTQAGKLIINAPAGIDIKSGPIKIDSPSITQTGTIHADGDIDTSAGNAPTLATHKHPYYWTHDGGSANTSPGQ